MKKFKVLTIFFIVSCLVVNMVLNKEFNSRVYLNTSKSLPRGLYLIKNVTPQIGDLVIIDLPVAHKNLLSKQASLKFEGLLLKPIIAMGGDYVCNDQNSILINQNIKLSCKDTMQLYQICRNLQSEELFVAITATDNSLDSRYFGPITNKDIKAVVRPWFIFNNIINLGKNKEFFKKVKDVD